MVADSKTIHRETTIPSDLAAAHQVQVEIEQALSKGYAFDEREVFAVKLAVEEALVNAIKHGNQMDPDKTVRVVYDLKPGHFDIRITDQGPGFDPTDVPDPTLPENLERPCGRGLMLIRHYMTDVHFQDEGNTIAMTKVHQAK
jgi:serine/threonine-protein kinase RsbW